MSAWVICMSATCTLLSESDGVGHLVLSYLIQEPDVAREVTVFASVLSSYRG